MSNSFHGHVSREDVQKGIEVRAILRMPKLLIVSFSVIQQQPFAWGLVLNWSSGNDHGLSLVSRSGWMNDVDTIANGILRARESSHSADFFC